MGYLSQYQNDRCQNSQVSGISQPLVTWIHLFKLSLWLMNSEKPFYQCHFAKLESTSHQILYRRTSLSFCFSGKNYSLSSNLLKKAVLQQLSLQILLDGMMGRVENSMIFRNLLEKCSKQWKEPLLRLSLVLSSRRFGVESKATLFIAWSVGPSINESSLLWIYWSKSRIIRISSVPCLNTMETLICFDEINMTVGNAWRKQMEKWVSEHDISPLYYNSLYLDLT